MTKVFIDSQGVSNIEDYIESGIKNIESFALAFNDINVPDDFSKKSLILNAKSMLNDCIRQLNECNAWLDKSKQNYSDFVNNNSKAISDNNITSISEKNFKINKI